MNPEFSRILAAVIIRNEIEESIASASGREMVPNRPDDLLTEAIFLYKFALARCDEEGIE